MDYQITDTATIIQRLRDGTPCFDSQGKACRSRQANSGCDCTIAANKIESDAKVIAALTAALMRLANEVTASMGLMEPLCRREFGNTNYQCIMDAVSAAHIALGVNEQTAEESK
jgi:hypothetical protein